MNLGLEFIANMAPEVSFVHDFPGAVNTSLFDRMEEILDVLMSVFIYILGYCICVPIEERGEGQSFLATSARSPSASVGGDGGSGVPLGDGIDVTRGTNGEVGSGIYSIEWDGSSASPATQKLLAGYRNKGMVKEIRRHT